MALLTGVLAWHTVYTCIHTHVHHTFTHAWARAHAHTRSIALLCVCMCDRPAHTQPHTLTHTQTDRHTWCVCTCFVHTVASSHVVCYIAGPPLSSELEPSSSSSWTRCLATYLPLNSSSNNGLCSCKWGITSCSVHVSVMWYLCACSSHLLWSMYVCMYICMHVLFLHVNCGHHHR